jgi:hypothetical protein
MDDISPSSLQPGSPVHVAEKGSEDLFKSAEAGEKMWITIMSEVC